MRYIIDGYNVLFSQLTDRPLEDERNALIEFLNDAATKLSLDIRCAFDAAHVDSELVRTHYHNLEIIYTDKKQTADDWIILKLDRSSHPKNFTVVTNDQRLAWRARRREAKTQNVHAFFKWLRKKLEISPETDEKKPIAGSIDYYLYHFEKKMKGS